MHPPTAFSERLFEPDFQMTEQIGWGLNDHDFLQQMVPRLEQQRRPFAAWLITLSLHHPFESFPDAHKVLKLGALEGTSFGNYLHTMRFFDTALEEFKASLARDGLLDSSVLVVFGDHDAGFCARRGAGADDGHRRPTDARGSLNDRMPLFIRVRQGPERQGGMDGRELDGVRDGRRGRPTSRRRCSRCSGSIRRRCRISDAICSAPPTIGRCLARTATGWTRAICFCRVVPTRPASMSCAAASSRSEDCASADLAARRRARFVASGGH